MTLLAYLTASAVAMLACVMVSVLITIAQEMSS